MFICFRTTTDAEKLSLLRWPKNNLCRIPPSSEAFLFTTQLLLFKQQLDSSLYRACEISIQWLPYYSSIGCLDSMKWTLVCISNTVNDNTAGTIDQSDWMAVHANPSTNNNTWSVNDSTTVVKSWVQDGIIWSFTIQFTSSYRFLNGRWGTTTENV